MMKLFQVRNQRYTDPAEVLAVDSQGAVMADGWYYIYDGMEDAGGPFRSQGEAEYYGSQQQLVMTTTVTHRNHITGEVTLFTLWWVNSDNPALEGYVIHPPGSTFWCEEGGPYGSVMDAVRGAMMGRATVRWRP